MDHLQLGHQCLARGMALIQQLCEKEIIPWIKKNREIYVERKKRQVVFLPPAVKGSSAISKTAPTHFPTVASKTHENSDPWRDWATVKPCQQ